MFQVLLFICHVIHSRLFLKRDPSVIPEIYEVIAQLNQMSEGINEIHGVGDRAVQILETIQNKKLLQHPVNAPSSSGKSKSIRHLILVDRAVDLSSLFISPLTYEGLIDEIFKISINSIDVDADIVGKVS